MAIILAIDDNPLVLSGMTMLLESWGHKVYGASSSKEAVGHVEDAGAPDVIVSDYRLNDGGTGLDAVNAVNLALGHKVPALIVTGENNVGEMTVRGLPVLRKPISPDGLRLQISEAMAK